MQLRRCSNAQRIFLIMFTAFWHFILFVFGFVCFPHYLLIAHRINPEAHGDTFDT